MATVGSTAEARVQLETLDNVLFAVDDVNGIITRCETVLLLDKSGGSTTKLDCATIGRLAPGDLDGNLAVRLSEGGNPVLTVYNRATKALYSCAGRPFDDNGKPNTPCVSTTLP